MADVQEITGPVRVAITVLEPDTERRDAIFDAIRDLAEEERGDDRADRGNLSFCVVGPGAEEGALEQSLSEHRLVLFVAPEEHPDRAARALALGADDALVWSGPSSIHELRIRAQSAIEHRRTARALETERRDLTALLHLSEALSSTKDIQGTLFHIARQVAEVMQSERCSIILLDEVTEIGFVVAASDDPSIRSKQIQLAHYPEIVQVVRTQAPLVIDDVHRDPIFDGVRELIRGKKVGNTALFPVQLDGRVVGVIHARGAAVRTAWLSAHQLNFGNIVANSAAIAIRNARLLQSIRDRAERVLSARFRAERRIRQLEKYQRFFDLAGDGLVIVDGKTRILFANRAATNVLGFGPQAITQIRLLDIVESKAEGRIEELLASLRRGDHRRRVDLPVIRASGEAAILSLSTASLDPEAFEGDEGAAGAFRDVAAIISFRDVTETRRLEAELRSTKEFLENLVESSADAIVAADITGKIRIFNKGAELITGWDRAGVIGKESVEVLFAPGVGREILRRMRTDGTGRYQATREELIAKDGTMVPISLAAALIYDGGKESAVVGIFSDLRERLRIEEQLAQAQKKLELTERQAAVVELAGAAAHELSQPLTSILGSAELMARKIPSEAPLQALLSRILGECERMTEIVKNIGRITKYETKPYVGVTNILDLSASSKSEDKQ
jgi:PAS domain S-box-containing protein